MILPCSRQEFLQGVPSESNHHTDHNLEARVQNISQGNICRADRAVQNGFEKAQVCQRSWFEPLTNTGTVGKNSDSLRFGRSVHIHDKRSKEEQTPYASAQMGPSVTRGIRLRR